LECSAIEEEEETWETSRGILILWLIVNCVVWKGYLVASTAMVFGSDEFKLRRAAWEGFIS